MDRYAPSSSSDRPPGGAPRNEDADGIQPGPRRGDGCDSHRARNRCGAKLYQRTDDNEETIKARMQVYQTSTQPIIDYYAKQHKLKKLDGNLETVDLANASAAMVK